MKSNIFTCLFVLLSVFSFSQSKQFVISGTLTSEEDGVLEAATIHLERIKDSTLVTYTISDKNGAFVLEDKTGEAELNLFVSYVGYSSFKKKIDLTKGSIDLGKITLETDTNALDEIIITSIAPVTIKKDTLEFNASSFKTSKNANLEALLKKLPGLEVDADGKITVNGKDVDKVLVNGKPFFGNDPTIATRNLTKEIIKKIQITDTKTKAQAFAGEEGSRVNKTINFTIRDEDNKGKFGKVAAGVGTDNRYEFSGMLNSFKKDKRLSVLVGGNNINSPGFGSLQTLNRTLGGGNGITTSKNAGVNFSDSVGEKIEVSSDYFYSESNIDSETFTERENILPDTRFFSNSESSSITKNDNHKVNFDIEIKLDSTLYINTSTAFNYSENNSNSSTVEESLNNQNVLTNASNSFLLNNTNNKSFNNTIDVTKRFGNKGSFLRLNVTNNLGVNKLDSKQDSKTDFYNEGEVDNSIVRKQLVDGDTKSTDLGLGLIYRLPLKGKELFLDATYAYNKNKQEDERNTFDFDQENNVYNSEITNDLSSNFEYTNTTNTTGLKLTYQKENLTTSIKTNYILRELYNKDELRPELSDKENFEALELGANFNYRFNKTSSLRLGYNLNNNSPQLAQLQAFEDQSNPLNITIGNPELEPENSHGVNIGYNKFDFKNRTGFRVYVNGGFINNQIVNKVNIDEDLVRKATYKNVNGNYNINSYLGMNKSIKIDTVKTIRYALGLQGGINNSVSFNNDVKYASQNLSLNPNVELTFSWNNKLEFTSNYSLSFNKTTFDIDTFEKQEFLTHALGVRTSTTTSKKLNWENDVSYNYNPNVASGFQKSSWFWNSSITYSMFKNRGDLSLKVYDLLNQNTNARRIANANYIQDTKSNILKRYFMLSFNWKLNNMGGSNMRRSMYQGRSLNG